MTETFTQYLILGMTSFTQREVSDPLSDFRDINFKVIPEKLRVFPDDEEEITVKVENRGEDEFEFELLIRIPEGVTLIDRVGNVYSNEWATKTAKPSQRALRKTFTVTHDNMEAANDEIEVELKSAGFTSEKSSTLISKSGNKIERQVGSDE